MSAVGVTRGDMRYSLCLYRPQGTLGKALLTRILQTPRPHCWLDAWCCLDHLKCVCMNIHFIIFIGPFTNIPVIRSSFPSCIMAYTINIHTHQELWIVHVWAVFSFPRLHTYARMIRKAVLKTLSETQVWYMLNLIMSNSCMIACHSTLPMISQIS